MQDLEIKKRVAENIKKIRKQRKMTQFELAEKANLSEGTIKNIELAHAYPEEKTLSLITEALDVDVVSLFVPVDGAFKNSSANLYALKESIAADVKNYVSEVLKEIF